MFPISSPSDYAKELANELGLFHTTGMVEEHGGLNNGRFDEQAYLAQCDDIWREREQMMLRELASQKEGFFYCLFDTPDRVQHMFWRFQEENHPANHGHPTTEFAKVIQATYRKCDDVVGRALEFADDRTLFIALSDHGFNSFRRGVHLNGWLHQRGLLALKPGTDMEAAAHGMLQQVDWSQTKAYALGLGSIYFNLAGREANGIVKPDEIEELEKQIVSGLDGLPDSNHGTAAIRSVSRRREIYSGPYADESPDLVVNFAAGYRASWTTALGGVTNDCFEDNTKKWSGDHIIDPALVPGVLFMNRPFRGDGARLIDLAPTILQALGPPPRKKMEGDPLLR